MTSENNHYERRRVCSSHTNRTILKILTELTKCHDTGNRSAYVFVARIHHSKQRNKEDKRVSVSLFVVPYRLSFFIYRSLIFFMLPPQ
jgi:hypothetical protein